MMQRPYEVIIIGGGQAGLALGYLLQRQRRRFIILDAAPAVGHAWRTRWDSLTLFTPCPHNSLPGLAFPKPPGFFPTKDDVADYLQQYVATYKLPIQLNQPVLSLEGEAGSFVIHTATATLHAQQVVIATGPFQTPFIPQWSADLISHVAQIHSSCYRNPQQISPGSVVVVGAGNSGVQIAKELASTHAVTLAVSRRFPSVPQRVSRQLLFWHLYLSVATHVTTASPLGALTRKQDIVFGNSLRDLQHTYGITLVGRAHAASGDCVQFQNGRAVVAQTVIWATGFQPDYRWLKLPVCDAGGQIQQRGGVTAVPGLHVLGLFWQTWSGSSLLGGVERDARGVADHIASLVATI